MLSSYSDTEKEPDGFPKLKPILFNKDRANLEKNHTDWLIF